MLGLMPNARCWTPCLNSAPVPCKRPPPSPRQVESNHEPRWCPSCYKGGRFEILTLPTGLFLPVSGLWKRLDVRTSRAAACLSHVLDVGRLLFAEGDRETGEWREGTGGRERRREARLARLSPSDAHAPPPAPTVVILRPRQSKRARPVLCDILPASGALCCQRR